MIANWNRKLFIRRHCMNKVKKLLRSFDFVLVSWILYAELLSFMMMLCFWAQDEQQDDGLLRYVGLRSEGTQKVWILKCEEYWQLSYREKTYRLECAAFIDGQTYRFTADAVDVIGENDKQMAEKYAKDKKNVTGTLYSSNNRKNMYFSCKVDSASKLFWRKVMSHVQRTRVETYFYRVLFYFAAGISLILLHVIIRFDKFSKKKGKEGASKNDAVYAKQLSSGDYAMMNATGAALTQTAYRMYQDSIDENPYDDYQLKPLSKKACSITHVILFFACFAVSVVFWYSTVDWPLLPAMIIALLIIRAYGHLYHASSRKYLAYFGEGFAKSWYYKLGEIWYAILGAFFMITTWLRFLNFGFFGLV